MSTQKTAEHIHKEYGYSTPEYKDERVLQLFINQLETRNLLCRDQDRLMANLDTQVILEKTEKILRPHLTSLIDQQLLH